MYTCSGTSVPTLQHLSYIKLAKTRPDLALICAVQSAEVDKVESILHYLELHGHIVDVGKWVSGARHMKDGRSTTTALLEVCRKADATAFSHPSRRSDNSDRLQKYQRITQLLLDHGADPTVTGEFIDNNFYYEFVPFHVALTNENLTLIRQLLDGNAEVNQTNHEGQTALHIYCTCLMWNRSEILRILIEAQADFNLQDIRGQTPLHISCRGNHPNHDLAVALVQNGALATIKDNNGDCPLHMVAVKDSRALLGMVDLCLAEPKESMELIIEALELTALLKSCSDPFKSMRMATQLRIEHDIQKRILEPMECYGFHKEWETIEELEAYRGDEKGLILQAVLARERIHQGQTEKFMKSIHKEVISDVIEASKSAAGTLLEHHLQICCREEKIQFFVKFVLMAWKKQMEERFESFSTRAVVQLTQFAIECLTDGKISYHHFTTALSTVTTMMMKLYRRNRPQPDSSKDERMLARELLQELFDKVPLGPNGYLETRPIQYFITAINFTTTAQTDIISRTPYDKELMKMLLESGKVQPNDVDCQGNTLLHSAMESINSDLCFHYARGHQAIQNFLHGTLNQSVATVKLLLEKGVYPNARNRKDRRAQDMLLSKFTDDVGPVEETHIKIKDLVQQYEDRYSMTLLTKAAVVVCGLPYKDLLKARCPGMADRLINFVSLHGDPNYTVSLHGRPKPHYWFGGLNEDSDELCSDDVIEDSD